MNESNIISQENINEISYKIIGCAIEVHKELGPGLLESVYESCLIDELKESLLNFQKQIHVPIHYKQKNLGGKLKLDLIVEDLIIVELKAVDEIIPLHKAQLLSYLKLAGKPKGLLINFHFEVITQGLVSLVTESFFKFPEK